MSVVRGARGVAIGAAALVVVALVLVVRSTHDGNGPGPVDAGLAAKIRAAGVTPYLVDLEGAKVPKVSVRDDYPGLVLVDYDAGDDFTFRLGLARATSAELCKGGHEEYEDGGSCTSTGNRMTTEFEEMGTFTERKGDTDVSIDTIIDRDDGLPKKAFTALDEARKVTVDELARY